MALTFRKQELDLATSRSPEEPRKFKHMGRLLEFIESNFPDLDSVVLDLKKTPEFLSENAVFTR